MRLVTDIDANQAKRIFDILYQETNIFQGYSLTQVEAMSAVFKFLSFRKGDEVCKRDDYIDFFGIICHGSAFITFEYANMKTLSIGSMIGQMNAAEFSTREKHLATIVAGTDGLIAVIPFGELKMEVRKNPQEIFNIMQVATKNAMETLYYNVHGVEVNPVVKHVANGQMNKKLRDFYFKNPAMRAFLQGIEKRDERFIIQALRTIEFEAGDRVVRRATNDKSVLFVAGGKLIAFSYEGVMNDKVYTQGAILGIEQFLFDKPWEEDIMCDQQATVCKLKYENMLNLIATNALAASRLYKRIMRHYCFEQIYEKKRRNMHLFLFRGVQDEDLFIDFKLDLHTKGHRPNDSNLFNLMLQARPAHERNGREDQRRGQEHEVMPYFLTDQYKQILRTSKLQEQEMQRQADAAALKKQPGAGQDGKGEDKGPVGIYKSIFLRTKVEQQNEKRKRDRKAKATGGGSPRAAAAAAGATGDGATKKRAGGRGGPRTENEEQLLQIIEDLRNDLRLRDEEYQEQSKYVDKLQQQNDYLKNELRSAKLSAVTLDSKLAKITTVKELDHNFQLIERNQFFENRKTRITQLNASLSNSVKDQYKMSQSVAYAAKYARIWIDKVRKRIAERNQEAQDVDVQI